MISKPTPSPAHADPSGAHRPRTDNCRAVATAVALAANLILPACAPRSSAYPPVEPLRSSPATLTCAGDWDDVTAAVEVSLTRCWLAIEKRTLYEFAARGTPADPIKEAFYTDDGVPVAEAAGRIEYDLVTISGVTGTLVVERLGQPADLANVPIRLTCSIGLADERHIETCMVDSVRLRLDQLLDTDTAPVHW